MHDGKIYAVKVFSRSILTWKAYKQIINEIVINKMISHPKIPYLKEFFVNKNHIHLILEYSENKDLMYFLEREY